MSPLGGRAALFYSVVILVLLVLVFRLQNLVLSDSLGARIGHNSEVLGLVLLICTLIQYVRPWVRRRRRAQLSRVIVVFAVLATGYLVLHFAIPVTSVSTLDECFSGAAYIWLYIMIPDRFRSVPVVVLLVLVMIIVFFNTTFVLEQAESLIPLLIAPFALDVMDRTILSPTLPDRRVVRIVWVMFLAAVGLTFMVTAPWAREDLSGPLAYAIDYGQRASEAYWSWIIVHLYFGFWLTPRLRRELAAPDIGGQQYSQSA